MFKSTDSVLLMVATVRSAMLDSLLGLGIPTTLEKSSFNSASIVHSYFDVKANCHRHLHDCCISRSIQLRFGRRV